MIYRFSYFSNLRREFTLQAENLVDLGCVSECLLWSISMVSSQLVGQPGLRSLAADGSIKPYSMNCSGLDGTKPLRY